MPRPIRSAEFDRETLWKSDRPRFSIDQIKVEHEFPGGKKLEKKYYSFERVDAVSALIVNRDTGMVMLVDQFRAPIAGKDTDGVLTETPAGMVDLGESWERALKREVEEETGYVLEIDRATGKLKDCELIADFFPSPGGSSERIRLYYVEVDSTTPSTKGGGVPEEDEFVEPNAIRADDFIKALNEGKLRDAKTIIAGFWLKDYLRNHPGHWRLDTTTPGHQEEFTIAGLPGRTIGYSVGDIGRVKNIDVWVNSENTSFLMDQFGGRTISSRIRTLGAKFEGQQLIRDTIQIELDAQLTVGGGVSQGHVISTGPGELANSDNNVKYIIHASVVRFDETSEDGVRRPVSSLEVARNCLKNALAQFDKLGAPLFRNNCSSMIVPLLGTGQGGVDRQQIVADYIDIFIDYLTNTPASKLKKLYLLAYSPLEIEICDRLMSRHMQLSRKTSGASK